MSIHTRLVGLTAAVFIAGLGCSDPPTSTSPQCWQRIGPDGVAARALIGVDGSILAAASGTVWWLSSPQSAWEATHEGIAEPTHLERLPGSGFLVLTTAPGVIDPFNPPDPPWILGSADGGQSWSALADPGGMFEGGALTAASDEGTLFVSAGSAIARSSDLGQSWEAVRDDMGGLLSAAARSPVNGWIWFGGTDVLGKPVLTWSRDGGDSWATVDPTGGDPLVAGFGVGDFLFDLSDQNHLIVGTGGGLVETWDGGETWIWHRPTTTEDHIRYLRFVTTESVTYAFVYRVLDPLAPPQPALFVSGDMLATWEVLALPDGFGEFLTADLLSDGRIAVSTDDGVWLLNPQVDSCFP